jgi:serine/threonine protein kinase
VESLVGRVADEFIDRLNHGEEPDIEAYAQRFPQIASILRQALPALQVVGSQSTHAGAACFPSVDEPIARRQLGDFRIEREIGRGGMGVVYEAEQLSLGRKVALKILPFASTLDARQLQRFNNEAHAAAQLHHTNIVPVHAVGCERGVHYYAMQFIDGQNLASIIHELRRRKGLEPEEDNQPGRPLSQITDDLATSSFAPSFYAPLDHWPGLPPPFPTTPPRDRETTPIAALSTERSTKKPAFYRTVVTLAVQAAEALEHAHRLGIVHRDIKPANLLVDGRGNLWITDFGLAQIQGETKMTMTGDMLGTLRYMSPEQALGNRALIDHRTDMYSLGVTLYELLTLEPAFSGQDRQELVRRISLEEPRRLRSLNKDIPSELEIIVLKAMEKDPADRYATSQELADDLRRHLENRPILARRPTVTQRMRKFIRRHSAVAATAGVALALLLVMTSLGLLWNNLMIRHEQERTREEQERTQAANERLRANLDLSLKTLDEIYLKVLEVRLPRDREAAQENQDLLTKALGFYEQFAQRNQDDPKVRREVASAYDRAGVLHMRLGHYDLAAAALGHAEETAVRPSAEYPEEPELRGFLAEIHLHKGQLAYDAPLRMKEARQGIAAEKEYRQAIEILEPVIEKAHLGLKSWQTLASLHSNLASLGQHGGDLVERENHYRKAITVQNTVVDMEDKLPRKLFAIQQLAAAHTDLGGLLGGVEGTGNLDEGENELRQAIVLLNRIDTQAVRLPGYLRGRLPGFPNGQPVPSDLARAYLELGGVLRLKGRYKAADSAFSRAVACAVQVVKDWPGEPAFRRRLAATRRDYGILLFEQGKRKEALEQYRQSVDMLLELEKQFPDLPDNQDVLCDSLDPLAELFYTEGDQRKATNLYRQIIDIRERLAAQRPQDATHCGCLAWFYAATCIDPQFRNPSRAVVLAEKALAQFPQNAYYCGVLGVAQYRNGQWREAVASLEKANRLRRYRYEGFLLYQAMAHWHLGEKEAARACYDQAAGLMQARDYPAHLMSRAHAEARELLGIPERRPLKVTRNSP